jgi:hypothetical protein
MVPQLTLSNLFPFTSAYNVYTGTCDESNPVTYDANYYAGGIGSVTIQPGATGALNVFQPPLNIRVRRRGSAAGVYANGIRVRAYQIGLSDCTEGSYELTTRSNGTSDGWVSQLGTDYDPGLPFGTYELCFFDTTNNRRKELSSYDNTNATGRTGMLEVDSSSWSTGYSSFNQACPA